MKLNQKGMLDMTLIVALVAVLAIGGFVLYRVTKSDINESNQVVKTSQDQPSTTNDQTEVDSNTEGIDSNSDSNDLNSWAVFEDPQSGFTMRLPNGWSVIAAEDYSGFYSIQLQDDPANKASIQVNPTGGRGGPFLFSAGFIEDGDMLDPQLAIDSTWINFFSLDSTRYTKIIETDGPEGNAGDKVLVYLFEHSPNDFRFTYLMSDNSEDQTEIVEAALSTLVLN